MKPVEYELPKRPARRRSRGVLYEYRDDLGAFGFPPLWPRVGHEITDSKRVALAPHDGALELKWDPISEHLSFTNPLTGQEHPVESLSPADPLRSDPAAHRLPSADYLKVALVTALKAGYSSKVASQVIGYGGVNLNMPILYYDHEPADTGIFFYLRNEEIPVTALEWAVEHNRSDLVTLLLENGADPKYTGHDIAGPALVRAVFQRQAPELVKLLVTKTRRASCTRALCAAVDRQDAVVVETLLASGVRCEFQEVDLPPVKSSFNYDNDGVGMRSQRLEAHDLLALVRAARLGNANLVRLLLAHGADVNIDYHCDSNNGLLPRITRRHRG